MHKSRSSTANPSVLGIGSSAIRFWGSFLPSHGLPSPCPTFGIPDRRRGLSTLGATRAQVIPRTAIKVVLRIRGESWRCNRWRIHCQRHCGLASLREEIDSEASMSWCSKMLHLRQTPVFLLYSALQLGHGSTFTILFLWVNRLHYCMTNISMRCCFLPFGVLRIMISSPSLKSRFAFWMAFHSAGSGMMSNLSPHQRSNSRSKGGSRNWSSFRSMNPQKEKWLRSKSRRAVRAIPERATQSH